MIIYLLLSMAACQRGQHVQLMLGDNAAVTPSYNSPYCCPCMGQL